MYYIYHIPGKKIGVTRDLNKRVTVTQGYKKGEYEVLDSSEDIDYVSRKELELQYLYGYKIDRRSYKSLFNKKPKSMLPRATEATTTFDCPVNKLKGRLMDIDGVRWNTPDGHEFEINKSTTKWIVKNAKSSMFDKNKSFIYNKAFAESLVNPVEELDMFKNIRAWAKERGIYDKGNSQTQYVKLMEEAGELAQSLLKNDRPEIIDAIGDMVVVLTNLAELENVRIEECVTSAYNEIANRKGEMVNGTFVKQVSVPTGTTDHWKKVTL